MKALSIKNPWAELIVNEYKTYEFRSFKTKYRGKILIHASKTLDKDFKFFTNYNLKYTFGAIIGEANIADCVLVKKEFNDKLYNINNNVYKANHEGLYAWKLENIIKYEKPIYVKGQLGLWNYEKEV